MVLILSLMGRSSSSKSYGPLSNQKRAPLEEACLVRSSGMVTADFSPGEGI